MNIYTFSILIVAVLVFIFASRKRKEANRQAIREHNKIRNEQLKKKYKNLRNSALASKDIKIQFYQKRGFTQQEIVDGENLFLRLKTEIDILMFANNFGEAQSGLTNPTHVAIINIVAHEELTYAKNALAEKLSIKSKNPSAEGSQEFYEMVCWWIDFETDQQVKFKLVGSLLDYTTIREDAKTKIIELINNDRDVIDSLLFRIEYSSYDYNFCQQVKREIDKFYLTQIFGSTKANWASEMKQPLNVDELLNSTKKGFKVSFSYMERENPDPREGGTYQHPVVIIGNKNIYLWSKKALYNEDLNLLCFFADSSHPIGSVKIIVANLNSLQNQSLPPKYYYIPDTHAIGSYKNTFIFKVSEGLLTIDVSDFPTLKSRFRLKTE